MTDDADPNNLLTAKNAGSKRLIFLPHVGRRDKWEVLIFYNNRALSNGKTNLMTVQPSHPPPRTHRLKRGILSVLQTPFGPAGKVDLTSLANLVEDAIHSGVDGLLTPAVASEVDFLNLDEHEEIVRTVAAIVNQRVPLVVGASSNEIPKCQRLAALAEEVGAAAYLVAVPATLYDQIDQVVPFFRQVASTSPVPLLIQDLQWNGPGLELETIARLINAVPTLIGLKIETVPAGPKYTAVRQKFGNDFFIAGGWAVPQWIEALDRDIDAMIPESAMVRVYAAILSRYRCGQRDAALNLFHRLLPILSFSNQEIALSIAFFKRLLVRRGVFQSARMRIPNGSWDAYHSRIADELIELYLELEDQIAQ